MSRGGNLGFGHENHPLPGRRVHDLASGTEGALMAVVVEEIATHTCRRWTRRAYTRPEAGGRRGAQRTASPLRAAQRQALPGERSEPGHPLRGERLEPPATPGLAPGRPGAALRSGPVRARSARSSRVRAAGLVTRFAGSV
ncbi:hypothetical protein [Streptomyces sp. NPDC085665]|uniref:hypothetical protein n=1 Tax=Streptomyces sp. NPDC085665 TaxID=3365735 RepID=UPI0037CE4705